MTQTGFEYCFSIRLRDTDAAGVLFFARLLEHAHDAYETLMDQLDHPLPDLLHNASFHLPLVHAEADYLAPLRLGDRVRVSIQVAKLGRRSFTLSYAFATPDGRICARAATVHVAIDAREGKKEALPEPLREALQGLGVIQV